jgi:rubrerythrin
MLPKTIAECLETAIKREEEAYAFYMDILGKIDDESVKETIEFIAGEEKKHRQFLIDYRDGRHGGQTLRLSNAVDYKVAEYLQKPEVEKDMDSAEVYLVASHRELASYNFYTEFADLHPEGPAKDMLRRMASEELKHKEKMEYLYANTAFPQTSGG